MHLMKKSVTSLKEKTTQVLKIFITDPLKNCFDNFGI